MVASLPSHLRLPSRAAKVRTVFLQSLNFYRVHLLAFTLIPLVMSAIMWGISTEYHIDYIDCLFNCMSAMTVTGLASVNLSTLSATQQVLLFVQMIIGSPTVVSIIMIVVRRHFFQQTFKHVIEERNKGRSSTFSLAKTMSRVAPGPPLNALKKKFSMSTKAEPRKESPDPARSSDEHTPASSSVEMKPVHQQPSISNINLRPPPPPKHKKEKKKHNISTSMIKRVEGGGVGLINPMGWYDAERADPFYPPPGGQGGQFGESAIMDSPRETPPPSPVLRHSILGLEDAGGRRDRVPDIITDSPPRMNSTEEQPSPSRTPYAGKPLTEEAFPRSKTIAFDDNEDGRDHDRGFATGRDGGFFPRTATHRSQAGGLPSIPTASSFPRTYSLRPTTSRKPDTRMSGFGGFPTPFEILGSVVSRVMPAASEKFTRTMTMPRTNTIGRRETLATQGTEGKEVPYISFSATVGRNSRFTGLTEEQMDELGGVEYRALRVLLYIVIGYVVFIQVAAFVIMAPYIGAKGRYDHVFEAQPRLVRIPWFALFQSVSAFSNTGMSLIDTSMIPFQKAYLMIFVMMFLIFAGNTAFPVFLRLTVWTIYKVSPATSRTKETLKFLLDHPRRCFVYLFPSTQTWVLAFVMIALTMTDWVCFLVLDIGTPVIAAIPVGTRIAAAFLQSAAVRAAGFGIVPLNSLAPAVKVLYTIMMYISVYPVALSVRSTNVYEERSLGLFNEDEEEEDFETKEKGAQAVAKYLGWHARRQLAFDIWWLGFALWLICIIERGHLDNQADSSWFSIFNIIFELVSGYGTVGLSLGVGYDNFSLSGSFRKLSKLVLIAVMLRGRHRGLPVAIDRAVMLPKDFTAAEEQAFEETRSRRLSRRGSTGISDEFLRELRRGSLSAMSTGGGNSGPIPFTGVPPTGRRESNMSTPIDPSTPIQSTAPQRRGSSPPGTLRSRADSNPPGSPTTLSFALPRTSTEREREGGRDRERNRSPVATKRNLTPVQESSMSRANTRTEQ